MAVTLAALAVAAVALVSALWYGGGVVVLPGEPALTQWLLSAARLGYQVAAVATVGLLLAAAVLAPHDQGRLSGAAYRFQRAAGGPAIAWTVCCVLVVCLTLADVSGIDADRIITPGGVVHFVTTFPIGRAFALSALLALIVAGLCRSATSVAGMLLAVALSLLALLPPLFTGHAAAGGNHQVAVSAMILHVVPVTLWAGGLLALLLTRTATTAVMAVAVRRFSAIAGWSVAAVAASGLISAAIRVSEPAMVFTSPYGRLMLVKAAVLTGLGALGWYQRRKAVPALQSGDRRRFTLVAAVELLLFGAATGVASALSRTPPPQPQGFPVPEETPAQALLGYPMPAPLTAGRLVADWLPEPLFLLAAVVAAALYLAGVRRLRQRGKPWPIARTAYFLAACAALVLATNSGVARYAPVLTTVHFAQYLLLATVIPTLLVLASPLRLVRRATEPTTDPSWRGPHEWARGLRMTSRPVLFLVVYAGAPYAIYLTGLYELSLRSHAAHLVIVVYALLSGCLFFRVVLGGGGGRYRLRAGLVLAAMVSYAQLGVALTIADTPSAAEWFAEVGRTWGPSPLTDLHQAGVLAWTIGQLPLMIVLAELLRRRRRAGRDTAKQDSSLGAPATSAFG